MIEDIRKWLIDIAKYVTTAVLLSSIFGDMTNNLIVVAALLTAILSLIIGIWLKNFKQ